MISLIYQTENCYCFYNHDIILCELHEKIAQKDCNHPFVADAIPIHHCWVKFKDSIIDLSDDFAVLFNKENAMHFQGVKSKEEYAEVLASFHQFVKEHHIPNSVRCCPIGKPHSSLVYIGSVCEPEEGRKIYNQLITQYPDHECHKNVGEDGMNATQRQLFQSGLM